MIRTLQKNLAAAALCALAAVPAFAVDITGAGATFPYPIYAKWADAYKKSTGTGMNYQSIGSGGGIKQITAKTVNFGASDMPLKVEDLEKNGLMQFPAIMGGVVPVYNLKGIKAGEVKFTGALLADIYLGKVKKWNDAAIAKVNPGVKLPDEQHHGRAPLRRVGHHVPVDQLPVQGERRLEERRGRGHLGQVAGRRGRQGQRRRRLLRPEDQRLAGLRRVRLREAEQAHRGPDAEPGGQVRLARRHRASRRRPPAPTGRRPRAWAWS